MQHVWFCWTFVLHYVMSIWMFEASIMLSSCLWGQVRQVSPCLSAVFAFSVRFQRNICLSSGLFYSYLFYFLFIHSRVKHGAQVREVEDSQGAEDQVEHHHPPVLQRIAQRTNSNSHRNINVTHIHLQVEQKNPSFISLKSSSNPG